MFILFAEIFFTGIQTEHNLLVFTNKRLYSQITPVRNRYKKETAVIVQS